MGIGETTAEALPQTPRSFRDVSPLFDRDKETASDSVHARGPMHHRRTVGLAIPCQVASPQSLTLFRQTGRSITLMMKKGAASVIRYSVSTNQQPHHQGAPDESS